jgi:hypothetical protein
MIQFFLVAFLALTVIASAAIFIATLGWKRARKAEAESKTLHEAFRDAARKTERLRQTLGEQTEAEEKANAERKELAGAADADLVGRANSLFGGGMPDKPASSKAGSD